MLLDILGFEATTIFSRGMVILIISLFMPLTAVSFFWFMIGKKEKDFSKSLREMGINSSRKVRDIYSPSRYLLPVSFVFLICFLSISYVTFADLFVANTTDSMLLAGGYFGQENMAAIRRSSIAVGWAFIGAFIWSAQTIIRRLIGYDLSPSVYYSAGIRMILAISVAVIFSFIVGQKFMFDLSAELPAIAFLAGMFPQRILSLIINLYKDLIDGDMITNKQLALENIEGISLSHKERLEEIGIDNAQNLATTSLTRLLIETPFGTRQLLDWIGQAKLMLYAKDNINDLRSIGIRSVFDLLKGQKDEDKIREMAHSINFNVAHLRTIHEQIVEDQGVQSLNRFLYRIDLPSGNSAPTAAETSLVIEPINVSARSSTVG